MESKGNFPGRKNNYRNAAKAPGEKSRNKKQGRKHHNMVPVENPAGCAAAVFHKPNPEGTPEKNADKVADVERNGKKQKHIFSDNAGEIKNCYHGGKRKPG